MLIFSSSIYSNSLQIGISTNPFFSIMSISQNISVEASYFVDEINTVIHSMV